MSWEQIIAVILIAMAAFLALASLLAWALSPISSWNYKYDFSDYRPGRKHNHKTGQWEYKE